VLAEQLVVALAQLLDETGRPLDVGEQEGDQPRGERLDARRLSLLRRRRLGRDVGPLGVTLDPGASPMSSGIESAILVPGRRDITRRDSPLTHRRRRETLRAPKLAPKAEGRVPMPNRMTRNARGRCWSVALAMALAWSMNAAPGRAALVPSCDPDAGAIQIVGYELMLTARSGEANDVTITLVGGAYTPPGTGVPLTTQVYRISDPGAPSAYVSETGCASDESAVCSQDAAGVTTCSAILTDVTISLGDGSDHATAAGVPAPVRIAGGSGGDTIVGGENGDFLSGGTEGDFIAGGAGDDFIDGATGSDRLEGGPGDDRIVGGPTDPFNTSGNDTIVGGPGHDTLDGGSGSLTDPDYDRLDYSTEGDPVTVDLTSGEGSDTVRGFEEVLGSPGDDDIKGHSSAYRIDGGPGNDTIDGQGAREVLGGEGDDVMYARVSADETLQGGPGDDRIYDDFECSCFIGDHNDDVLLGGPGNDRLVAGTGNNTLRGGDGDDWLVAGCEVDFEHSSLFGEAGQDTLSEIPESVLDDTCFFGNRHEGTVEHGDANDLLDGGADVDTLDLCVPQDPNSLDVPPGYRPDPRGAYTTCLRTAAQYATPADAGHTAYRGHTAEVDQLVSIQNVIGGGGNDLLFGMGGVVNGGPGSDDLSCGRALDGGPGGPADGGDVLRDCPGATYRGVADYSRRTEAVHVTLDGVANDGGWDAATATSEGDNVLATGGIAGGAADDELTGDGADNVIEGGAGADRIDAAGGQDVVFGNDGADTIDGGPGGDLLDGGADADTILARDGLAELIDCGSGTDVARLDRLDQPTDCETAIVGLIEAVSAGDVVTTDVEADGATPDHPVEVTITAATAGTVEATERPAGTNPSGYTVVGVRYDIRLPVGTPESPNILTFRIDASLIPAGQDQNDVAVFRNGVRVPECDPSPPRVATTAAPDPCVSDRRLLPDGDVEIVVLTSQASDWDIAVDVEAPTISITSPADGADLLLGAHVAAAYGCADAGSGIASCLGPVPGGGAVDTRAVGPHTFTVQATDRVGNASSATVHYRVIYDFAGFFSPLENPGHQEGLLNVVKAGAAIPVKFSLHGYQGMAIVAAGSPSSTAVTCDTHAPSDPVEETTGPGSSALVYDAATDTYRISWKTDKTWAGTCRALTLQLVDGTDHLVLFRLTK
jgi:Ca2+-binding RTX toxin-like protein